MLLGLVEDLLGKGACLPVGVPLLMALDNMVDWGEDFRDITIEGGVVFLAPIAVCGGGGVVIDEAGGVGLILLWCSK